MSRDKVRVGILISGRGSNMAAIIDATKVSDFPAKVAVVISNRSTAPGLATAKAAGIPTITFAFSDYTDAGAFDGAIDRALSAHGVQLVCLAGYMRLLTPGFLKRWHNKVLNIHPSLLPAFKGLDTHQRAINAGCRLHGCTVHIVRPELDEGPIVAQAAVPLFDDDTPDSLSARVLVEEHKLYPEAVRMFAEQRLTVEGMRVVRC